MPLGCDIIFLIDYLGLGGGNISEVSTYSPYTMIAIILWAMSLCGFLAITESIHCDYMIEAEDCDSQVGLWTQ